MDPVDNSQTASTPPTAPAQAVSSQTQIPTQTPPKKKGKLGMTISLLIILFLLFISGAAGYTIFKNLQTNNQEVACTLEAMICPDGSSVGREGPNCEFSPCPTPTPDPTADWKTYEGDGFSFKYPSDISVDPNNKNAMIVSKVPSAIEFYVLTEKVQQLVEQSEGLKSNEQIMMGGIPGVKIKGSEGIAGTVQYIKGLVENNNKTYYVGFSTQSPELFNNFSPKFDQILSTFKFTE